ncbi:MAG: flagellar biosynthetic protein FliR, partial [Myxococcota bacterium]
VLVEASLGLVARAAPQVPVFFAGMPLRAAAGLAGALLALAALGGRLAPALGSGIDAAAAWLRALGAGS